MPRKTSPPRHKKASKPFPVVGIGASAGGLEAFTQLLSHLPTDTGMGFVLVQHLDPKHESMLSNILSRSTKMPVREVAAGMPLEPNTVYVTPPAADMSLVDGSFRLAPREARSTVRKMPIDHFLRSLAETHRTQAVGVILSGTLSDGARGMQAIKAEGGITFAQDEDSSKFQDMPRAAIAAGSVDFILPPDRIARELARIARHPSIGRIAPDDERTTGSADGNREIFSLLRKASGVDFGNYRKSTINRRIARRMILRKIERLEDYIRHLRENPAEVRSLYEDILITVTGFFRDAENFAALRKRVLPAILKNRSANAAVRVWVPGCATGEEVYSIAICLFEALENARTVPAIQIFGTDISESAIDRARSGIYLENALADVSPERRRRFFTKTENGYQISKRIRDVCVFARQNVTTDPPFSNIDLLSCRNLLIYLEPILQSRIIPYFHYALKPRGFLMLGGSETITGFGQLFVPLDRNLRIFTKKEGSPRQILDLDHRPSGEESRQEADHVKPRDAALTGLDVQAEADRLVLSRFAPAGVVINDSMEILQFRGRTSPYLEAAPGAASLNILKMAREGLLVALKAAIQKAGRKEQPVRAEDIAVRQDGNMIRIDLEVIPIRRTSEGPRNYLVLFEEKGARPVRPTRAATKKLKPARGGARRAQEERVIKLEQELTATKDYLQKIIEEQEAANEELKSANEEILSSNEELQSTNEELETAKEELQSTNEELRTINDELQNRNSEVSLLNNDLSNVLSGINIAIVIVGVDGRIRRFTTPAEKLLNLIPTDVGRPIRDIKPVSSIMDLDELSRSVVETVKTEEREVQDREGRWYQLRIRPYRTQDNKIDGAVIVLQDIDPIKRSLEQARHARDYAQALVETVRESLVVLDDELRVRSANQAFYETFQSSPEETLGKSLFQSENGREPADGLRDVLEGVAAGKQSLRDLELSIEVGRLGTRILLVNARRVPLPGETKPVILLAIADITERKTAEAQLRASEVRYRQLFESSREGILLLDAETGAILDVNPFLLQLCGYSREELLGRPPWSLPLAVDAEALRLGFRELQTDGFAFDADLVFAGRNGRPIHLESLASVYLSGSRRVAQYNLRDITARREAEGETRRQKELTERIVDSSLDGIYAFDREFRLIVWNVAMQRVLGVERDAALGRKLFELFPFLSEIGEEKVIADVLRGDNVISKDRPYVSATGREGFFEAHYSPLRDESGDIIGGLAVLREVTSRKQFEEHLRQVQKLEALGTLSGGIAHDFNNLLNIVSAHATLLARESDDGRRGAHLDAVNKAVDRGASLVRQLLTFARKSETRFETVSLNAIVEEEARLLVETFAKKFEIKLELDPALPRIAADPNQIHQSLLNLCVNARDAMPNGGALLIRTGTIAGRELREKFPDARKKSYVLLAVKDTGLGIEESVRDRIFEPFFTTKEKGRGAGLGLALVYGIVKSHIGFIDCDTALGKGTEFRIYLPVDPEKLQASQSDARPRQSRQLPSPEKLPTGSGDGAILFAEDEEALASAVQSLLESEGYRVLLARDGLEALDLYERRKKEIAISILDLQMPKLGGWETFLRMKELDPAVKVIIASGDLGRDQRIQMQKAGVRDSLRKPYTTADVVEKVRRALDG